MLDPDLATFLLILIITIDLYRTARETSTMDSELETYQAQLSQVDTALSSDPTNAELLTLKGELENLISLTKSLAAASTSSSSASTDHAAPTQPTQKKPIARRETESVGYITGQEVLARYSDGRMYPARIVSIAGDPASPIYTVVYKGYGNTEMLSASSLRPLHSHHPPPLSERSTASTVTPPPPPSNDDNTPPPPPPTAPGAGADDKAKKKYRNEKKLARREEKSAIQIEKAASWQKFAAKKKGGIKESIFRTSDDPYAKVGVTKSSSALQKKPNTLG